MPSFSFGNNKDNNSSTNEQEDYNEEKVFQEHLANLRQRQSSSSVWSSTNTAPKDATVDDGLVEKEDTHQPESAADIVKCCLVLGKPTWVVYTMYPVIPFAYPLFTTTDVLRTKRMMSLLLRNHPAEELAKVLEATDKLMAYLKCPEEYEEWQVTESNGVNCARLALAVFGLESLQSFTRDELEHAKSKALELQADVQTRGSKFDEKMEHHNAESQIKFIESIYHNLLAVWTERERRAQEEVRQEQERRQREAQREKERREVEAKAQRERYAIIAQALQHPQLLDGHFDIVKVTTAMTVMLKDQVAKPGDNIVKLFLEMNGVEYKGDEMAREAKEPVSVEATAPASADNSSETKKKDKICVLKHDSILSEDDIKRYKELGFSSEKAATIFSMKNQFQEGTVAYAIARRRYETEQMKYTSEQLFEQWRSCGFVTRYSAVLWARACDPVRPNDERNMNAEKYRVACKKRGVEPLVLPWL